MTFFALRTRVSPFVATLHRASGWRRILLAFVFGSVLALAMPPFNLFPLLWVCLPALIFLLQGTKNKKQAFFVGWTFAFGFLMCSLYWIAASMLVDFHTFWWAIPLAVAVLPACFAIYYGLAAMLAWSLGLAGVTGSVIFALLWFTADYVRGHAFSGFPWNLVGYTWSGVLPVLQITSVIGIYGLTLLTILAASLPASLLPDGKPSALRSFLASLALFVFLAIGGEARLLTTHAGDVPAVRLRVVQPSVDQAHKWQVSNRAADFENILALTSAPADIPVTHVIWPETASTYYLSEDAVHREQIGWHIPAQGTVITGVIRRNLDKDGNTLFYNSMVAVDGLGRLVAGYDKTHLVPFGEYMPLRSLIPIKAIAADIADFTPGDGPRSLRVLGLPPFSPLICYEAIFTGNVIDRNDRPDFIINATNDAWYGQTVGPYQHFAIARVRAIEEGLPLIRAANTGISGVIDATGRIQSRLGLGQRGFIDSNLPAALPPTLFAQGGETPTRLLFLTLTVVLLAIRGKKHHKKRGRKIFKRNDSSDLKH